MSMIWSLNSHDKYKKWIIKTLNLIIPRHCINSWDQNKIMIEYYVTGMGTTFKV